MNEEAFKQLYESFVNTGYEGDRQMFIDLMSSNEEAFTQGYDAFTSTGYAGDRTAFANLVGVNDPLKKKYQKNRWWKKILQKNRWWKKMQICQLETLRIP